MLRAALFFFILALIAVLFGANNVAGLSLEMGKLLLFVFLVLGAITFVAHLITGKTSTRLQ